MANSESPRTETAGPTARRRSLVLILLLSLPVGAFAVTNQSFWIDEGHAALKAVQPTLSDWRNAMTADRGSDLQMPLYMLMLWAWEKLFGASEWALRALNIPFFAIALCALTTVFSGRRKWWLALAAVVNAFLFYYLSEARPYLVLFAFSCITAACLFQVMAQPKPGEPRPGWLLWFTFGLVGLCATNLIAMPWALGAGLAAVAALTLNIFSKHSLRYPIVCLCGALCLASLGLYYLWTLQLGARGSDVGRTALRNIAFVIYELSGVAGLGPGRNALREGGFAAFAGYLPLLLPGAALFAAVGSIGCAIWWRNLDQRGRVALFFVLVLPACLLFLLGFTQNIRLLGRHFTPALPYILICFALGLEHLWNRRKPIHRALAVLTIVVMIASAMQIRFAPRHRRDDYRGAVALAQQKLEEGKSVWWAADINTGKFYGLETGSPYLENYSRLLSKLPAVTTAPDVILLSKPDIYDPQGVIRNYLKTNAYEPTRTLTAFSVFEPKLADSARP